MKMDYEKFSFTTKGQGEVLADLEVNDCFQVGVAVDVTAVAGTPTSYRAICVALDGATEVGSTTEHIRKTADLTTTGKAFLGYRGTAIGEIAFENIYTRIRVIADFTGGTAPSITGNVYIFRKRF